MPFITIVEKTGEIKEHNIKDSKFNEDTLYKKIGLKTNSNFECIYNKNNILIYGKKTGKCNYLNIFPFTFLNNINLYGSCIILRLINKDDCYYLDNFKSVDFIKFIELNKIIVDKVDNIDNADNADNIDNADNDTKLLEADIPEKTSEFVPVLPQIINDIKIKKKVIKKPKEILITNEIEKQFENIELIDNDELQEEPYIF
jgi:hypothetical protein